jgi:hypothetical protein
MVLRNTAWTTGSAKTRAYWDIPGTGSVKLQRTIPKNGKT